MPRVNPYFKKPFESVARLLKGYGNASDIGTAIGKSYQTGRARLNRPEELTLGELRLICYRMHIPWEEILGNMKL